MGRRETWAIVIGLASSGGITGCEPAVRCLSDCQGSEAGATGEPPVTGTLEACPALRACRHVESVVPSDLGPGWMNPALVGNVVETASGPAVSWVATPTSLDGPRHVGISLLTKQKNVEVAVLDASVDVIAPPLFQRAGELDLVLPPDFDQVVPIPLDTLEPGAAIPLSIGGSSAPAVTSVGQALAALVGGAPRLQLFDATLGERLVDTPVGDQGYPLFLTRTCDGLLATWMAPTSRRAAAFTEFGERVAPNVDLPLRKPYDFATLTGTWDGAEVVLCDGATAVELDNHGNVLSQTPLSARVAVGTDDGLLTIRSDGESFHVEVHERVTGAVLSSIAAPDDFWTEMEPSLALVVDQSVYFVNRLGGVTYDWVRVDCGG